MQTFYRRSTDAGQTWGPETQLTNTTGFAYCPMISLYDSNVDFVWADRRPTTFNVYYKNSHDFGANWSMERQMSNGTANALYPVVARNKDYIHMIWYLSNSDVIYHQSKNNGLTWLADTGIVKAVNKPGSSYILSSGRVLHMIWIDRRNTQPKVYYKRNPTANLADTLAILTTDSVTAINNYSAVSGGNITNDGGSAVTMRGVVWDISTNPTVALLTKTNDGAGTGYFISSLTGLNLNTIYYVRAYAITNVGTSYGNERTFKTLATGIDESSIKNITVYSYDKNIIIRYNPETGNNPIISIYNLFGQELINITRDSKETVINMSLYPQGYYLVKIVAADKITLQKIFIK